MSRVQKTGVPCPVPRRTEEIPTYVVSVGEKAQGTWCVCVCLTHTVLVGHITACLQFLIVHVSYVFVNNMCDICSNITRVCSSTRTIWKKIIM